MADGKVTVGIPVVNELAYLRTAVRSVFAQTYSDWSLVIACDGSGAEVLAAVNAIQDPRVRVIADGESRGLPARLNELTAAATTPYVARMDADDVMHPQRLERQLAGLSARPDIDMLAAGSFIIDDAGEVCGSSRPISVPARQSGYLASAVFCHSSVVFRRQWALENPYAAEWVRTEDKELWLRSGAHSHFDRLDERLQFYRISRAVSSGRQAVTGRFDRRLMRRYWRQSGASRSQWLTLDLTSRAKQSVSIGLGAIGADQVIFRRKYAPLPQPELQAAADVLARVEQTPVPGWD